MCSRLVLVVVGADSVLRMPRGASGAETMVGVSVCVQSVFGMSSSESEPLSRPMLSGAAVQVGCGVAPVDADLFVVFLAGSSGGGGGGGRVGGGDLISAGQRHRPW